jgi:hypothetical protein
MIISLSKLVLKKGWITYPPSPLERLRRAGNGLKSKMASIFTYDNGDYNTIVKCKFVFHILIVLN